MIEWQILKRKMIDIYNANCYKNIEPDLDKMLGLTYECTKTKKSLRMKKLKCFVAILTAF